MDRLLFLDTETGGLDPQTHSLLTIGVVIWDKVEGIIYKQEMCQRLVDYVICKEALEINHFDVKKYKQEELYTLDEIIDSFNKIKHKFFEEYTRIPLAGHNISFDSSFLRQLYKTAKFDYEKIFWHRMVDTFSILQYLIHLGKVPNNIINSDKAFEFFGINVEGRHTALGDAVATAQLYEKMLTLIS